MIHITNIIISKLKSISDSLFFSKEQRKYNDFQLLRQPCIFCELLRFVPFFFFSIEESIWCSQKNNESSCDVGNGNRIALCDQPNIDPLSLRVE